MTQDASDDYVGLMAADDTLGIPFAGPGWKLPKRVFLTQEGGEDWLEFRWDGDEKSVSLRRQMLTNFVDLAAEQVLDPISERMSKRLARRARTTKIKRGIPVPQISFVSNKPAGDPDQTLAFARRFGPLGLCDRHNRSIWHLGSTPCLPGGIEGPGARIVRVRERLDGWFVHSRVARAVLNLIGKPQGDRRADFEAANRLFGRKFNTPAAVVNAWLAQCQLRLRLQGAPPRCSLFPLPPLLAQLGIQLAQVAAGRRQSTMALCAACARFFPTKRQPRPDHNHYCPKCGMKAAWRDAQQRWRERRRDSVNPTPATVQPLLDGEVNDRSVNQAASRKRSE
jgi:hypothetical protein